MTELERLGSEYFQLLEEQHFVESELDYATLENHKPLLTQFASVGNSGVTVFDLYRKEHVFTSYNFTSLFGFNMDSIEQSGNDYFDSRVHPDDFAELVKCGISMLKFLYQQPKEERSDYKMINEYRILNIEEKYVRVIEQHQSLELDAHGNVWLALSVIDISPNQDDLGGVKSQVLNFKTGKISQVSFSSPDKSTEHKKALTNREREILVLIKKGLYSKEISGKLSISIHTVNTHRQRILEKLDVENSMEAVMYGSQLGLL